MLNPINPEFVGLTNQEKIEHQILGTGIILRRENDKYYQNIDGKIEIELTKEQFEILSGQKDLEKEKEKTQEIERKFLVRDLPLDFKENPKIEIAQIYLSINPQEKVEARIRRKQDQKGIEYIETIKIGSGKIREEREITINLSENQYQKMSETFRDKIVEKTRYKIPYQDPESGVELTIELDIYYNNLDSLITAEVEFKNEQDSDRFTPPSWFGKEVTEDGKFKNQSLALYGIPKN